MWPEDAMVAAPNDGLFSGSTSIRVPRERKTALGLVLTVPITLAVIGFAFHQVTPTQVALLFVGGMVFVTLARGRLLGSSIRVRENEFPELVEVVERIARRLGVAPPQIFIRDDYFVPVNAIGLGEPYALVISSQYLQLLGPEELAFMIGRELGHIGAGNTRLLSLIVATGRTNPLIASLFGGWIRQTEYTADRAGVLCVAPDDAIKAIAMSTFHASGRRVEAAMLADQRKDIESDVMLRLGELTGMMPYAVNRVRSIETFVASDTYRYWTERLERDPLPVRTPLGPDDGPLDRRELASTLRRFLAFAIDVTIVVVIFHAFRSVSTSIGLPVGHGPRAHFAVVLPTIANVKTYVQSNEWLAYFPYAALLVATTGRTIGMMILDLRVVREDRSRPTIAQAVWRYSIGFVCGLVFVPLLFFWRGYLWERWSKTRLIGGRTGLS